MTTDRLIANHYTQGGLVNAIRDGVHKLGKTTDTVDINDLGPVDEFHIGGRRATERDASFVASVATYETALEQSGFSILSKRNRRDFALEFFTQLRATASGANGPPPLGLHILMGSNASKKIENMVENIARNRIAPVEIVAEKRS